MSRDGAQLAEVARLVEVMDTLRERCPWDRVQTHRSLVPYLVEETCETVEAVETGSPADLREELGDLLLQVVFHAKIASESAGWDLDDAARGITQKLIARHPHVFPDGGRPASDPPNAPRPTGEDTAAPADLNDLWELRKAQEKGRSSALDGIPEQLSALSRASKVIGRAGSHGVPVELPTEPIDPADLGHQVLDLVARARASGLDAEQVVRDTVRELENRVRNAESSPSRI